MKLEHHITSEHEKPCWRCGNPTRFIDIDFQAHLCPGACTEAKTEEFFDAVAGLSRRDRLNIAYWKDYRALTGQFPPRTQHPMGNLPDTVTEALAGRPDLIEWALGR